MLDRSGKNFFLKIIKAEIGNKKMFLNESGGAMKRKNEIKKKRKVKKIKFFFLNGRNLPMRKKIKKKIIFF
jgi:hypothetical protein